MIEFENNKTITPGHFNNYWVEPRDEHPYRPVTGCCYYNTKENKAYAYTNTGWTLLWDNTGVS